jgi:hypothetical protein
VFTGTLWILCVEINKHEITKITLTLRENPNARLQEVNQGLTRLFSDTWTIVIDSGFPNWDLVHSCLGTIFLSFALGGIARIREETVEQDAHSKGGGMN